MGQSFIKGMFGAKQYGLGLVWWGTLQGPVIDDGLIDLLSDGDPCPLKAAKEVLRLVEEKRVFFAKLSGIFGQHPGIGDLQPAGAAACNPSALALQKRRERWRRLPPAGWE